MWCDNDVRASIERVPVRERLGVRHVERSTRELIRIESCDERVGVYGVASADVDDDSGGLEMWEGRGVQDVFCCRSGGKR